MSAFTLFADRPVRDPEDQLWFASPKDRSQPKPIRRHLEQIAETLVAPLAPGAKPAASLTIAIHGAPGAGKSSALNVLWDLALAKARALAPGADGDAIAARLVRCSYLAPNWQSPELSARQTLVASMIVALAGGESEAVKKLLLATQGVAQDLGDASEPRDAQGRKMWASKMVGRIAVEVAKLRNVEDLLRDNLPDPSGKPRVLAMLIDDLDRCDPAFVYALLSELLERSDLDNFFFVLAASPGTLTRAVSEGAAAGAGFGPSDAHRTTPIVSRGQVAINEELAKLVQHIVEVPRVDVDGMRALLGRLFEDKLTPGGADPIFALHDLGTDAEPAGICLARALWPSVLAGSDGGQMLCAVMDAYVEMLVNRGLRRTAYEVLHEAYAKLGHLPHIRERFHLFLASVGAAQAARRAVAQQPVDVGDLIMDDPKEVPTIEAAWPRVLPLVQATTGATS